MILVTGGSGYIGSHILVELSQAGYDFVVYDNFSNSSLEDIKRVEQIIEKKIKYEVGDTRDTDKLRQLFSRYDIEAVVHLAGLKIIAESIQKPLYYYDNNVLGTLKLLEVMQEFGCKKIVFSSSASVYGKPTQTPIKEEDAVGHTTNPYGTSKYMIEKILHDVYLADASFQAVILRYFNPIGAHSCGLIGENIDNTTNNLMTAISKVALGRTEYVDVYGDNYDTKDGTGVRDYIHVVDVAFGHIKALKYINKTENKAPIVVNLGVGKGYSVFDVIKAYEKVSGKNIKYKIKDKRDGDIGECFADVSRAKDIFQWSASKTLDDMCRDTWMWHSKK